MHHGRSTADVQRPQPHETLSFTVICPFREICLPQRLFWSFALLFVSWPGPNPDSDVSHVRFSFFPPPPSSPLSLLLLSCCTRRGYLCRPHFQAWPFRHGM